MKPLARNDQLARNADRVAIMFSLLNLPHRFIMREISREAKLRASVNLGSARS